MQLKLSRTTFRRLIWLQCALLIAVLPTAIYEVENRHWSRFDADFNAISREHFGRTAELTSLEAVGAGVLLLLSVLSLIGMYRFRRWGRFAFLLSFVLASGLALLGPSVTYTSWMVDLLEIISTLSGGALLAMAYGEGLGADWFKSDERELVKE